MSTAGTQGTTSTPDRGMSVTDSSDGVDGVPLATSPIDTSEAHEGFPLQPGKKHPVLGLLNLSHFEEKRNTPLWRLHPRM